MTTVQEQRNVLFQINKFPKTQYLGSKEKIVDWILQFIPSNINTALDAFCGSSVVGYYLKDRGYKVYSNDFLRCNYTISHASIENKHCILEQQDIDILLKESSYQDNLIETIYTDIFFKKDQAKFLDSFRANVNTLNNTYKQSLALAIMNRTLTRKVTMGHFAHRCAIKYSENSERVSRNPNLARPIKDIFLDLVPQYNQAVFDNNLDNMAYCEDILTLLPKLHDIDLVYFDPPYCGRHPDYQSFYHLLETYVEYWKDKQYINSTKMYYPRKASGFVTKNEIVQSFDKLFEARKHIPYWIISYNSKSYPNKADLISMLKSHKKVEVYTHEYQNNYGGRGSRKGTLEYLFYCY